MERAGRRQCDALQRLAARDGDQPDGRCRPTHHTRHDFALRGEQLRPDFRGPEPLLQLGPPPDQRRLHGRSQRHEQSERLPFQLTGRHDGRIVVPERPAFQGQPADRRRGLLPLRRRGVEQIRRGRPQGRALRHRRQVAGRGGRLRRFPAGHRGLADLRRRAARRPPFAHRDGVDPAGGAFVPPAAHHRAEARPRRVSATPPSARCICSRRRTPT